MAVGRDGGLCFPRGGGVDLRAEWFGCGPAVRGAADEVEVAVGVGASGVDDGEVELGPVGGEAYAAFGMAAVEGGG